VIDRGEGGAGCVKGSCKTPNFCGVCKISRFTGDFGLQKSSAEAHSFATTFATVKIMNIVTISFIEAAKLHFLAREPHSSFASM
jgi:hypothetical protein